jgi:hypothetical protein
MEHDADKKENEAGPWQVDIDHSTAKCEGSDSICIVATVTGKNTVSDASQGK